jgi:hypothetical protein
MSSPRYILPEINARACCSPRTGNMFRTLLYDEMCNCRGAPKVGVGRRSAESDLERKKVGN